MKYYKPSTIPYIRLIFTLEDENLRSDIYYCILNTSSGQDLLLLNIPNHMIDTTKCHALCTLHYGVDFLGEG